MTFNAESFLNTKTTQAGDTSITPIPVGEYPALVSKLEAKQWTGRDDPTKSGVSLNITWEIESPELKQQLGRDKITVRQSLMLDLTVDGGLDFSPGKNVGLGRLREALGLNTPGEAFTFAMLPGRAANVKVSHRLANEETYSEVKSVSAL